MISCYIGTLIYSYLSFHLLSSHLRAENEALLICLWKLKNFIDFQFTQLFFQNKKDLAIKLWEMIKNMVTEDFEHFNLGINKKISIKLKSVKACHFEVRSWPRNNAFNDFCIIKLFKTRTFSQFIFKKLLLLWINNCVIWTRLTMPPKYYMPLKAYIQF